MPERDRGAASRRRPWRRPSGDLEAEFFGLLDLDGFLPALHHVLRLHPHDAASPAPPDFRVVVELRLEVVRELVEFGLVLLPDPGQRDDGRALLVHELAEAALAFDDAVGHVLLAAER